MKKKKTEIMVSLLVIIFAIIGIIGYKTLIIDHKKVNGEKEFSLIVEDANGTFKREYNFKTEETSLGKDLDNRELIKTDNSGTSRFVTSVDNKEADASKKEWWNIKVNGEDSQTGVDEIMIHNGDKYEFVLTTGW